MSPKIHYWQWPNLLSIDAAIIAVAWQLALAGALKQPLPLAASVVLALSVWLTYMADRLLDVAARPEASLLSARHAFTKRHANQIWRIWTIVLGLNLAIALLSLHADQLLAGAVLLAICLTYTALNQKLSRYFFPKEACVALIYTGGITVFQRTAVPVDFALFFALLCLGNCLVIGAKEKTVDAKLKVHSLAPVVAERWLAPAALGLLLLVIILIPIGAFALGLGFLSMAALQLLRQRLTVERFRVLADAALLTPALIWLFV